MKSIRTSRSLHENVWPLYEALTSKRPETGEGAADLATRLIRRFRNSASLGYMLMPRAKKAGVERAPESWATPSNLCIEWVLEYARDILARWHKHPPRQELLLQFKARLGFNWREFECEPFVFEAPSWQVSREDWKDYASRATASFKTELMAYREGLKSAEQTYGLPALKGTGSRHHLRWLALYQLPYAQELSQICSAE